MFRHRRTPWIIGAVLFVGTVGLCPVLAQNRPPEINPPPGQTAGNPAQTENVEPLTRGPLHEAFALPYASQPEAGLIVKQRPPDPIEEVPPEAAPAGENVEWIPGYWGWEPTEENFIWVSGLWRNVPPERRWIPGYWTEVPEGYQWVSGFWASTEERELSYLPTPPETLERGPNIDAPEGDYFWTPGCWIWADNDYQWRPGYWAAAQDGWIWIPDHYTWTPYGVVFVNGYWDRDFLHRGTLFSPVRFTRIDPGLRFVPLVTIDPQIVLVHLFVNRPYDHYHFGDYYAVNDARFGILPWVTFDRQLGWYDPLLTYYQWNYGRRGVDLTQRLTAWNQYFVQHEEFRPPTTFAAQQQFATKFRGQENVPITQAVFSQPLKEILATDEGRQQFRTVPDDARREIVQNLEQFRSIKQQRAELEAVPKALEEPTARPNRTGQPGGRLAKTLELPQAVTTLKPPSATEQPQTTDTPRGRRSDQPSADRPEQVPPPVRPRQPQPETRPDQPGARPDQPETRPDQPKARPEQPRTRPDQPGARPDQPGAQPPQETARERDAKPVNPDRQLPPANRPDEEKTRPGQPGTQPRPGTARDRDAKPVNPDRQLPPANRPDEEKTRPGQPGTQPRPGTARARDAKPVNPDRQIPPFNFRRQDQQPPRDQAPVQPGQNPQQIDPRNRRGFDSVPPGLKRPEGNPRQPAARPPAQEPRGNPPQAGPPRGNPGQASPPPANPGQAVPPRGNPGQASPPPGNPGQGGPPKRGENPPGRGKKEK